jgi:hypothetical protein
MGTKNAVALLHIGIKTAVALVIGASVAESFQHTPSIGVDSSSQKFIAHLTNSIQD